MLPPYDPDDDTIKYQRVEPGPDQCEEPHCNIRKVPGGSKCWIHGGASTWKAQKQESLRNYKIERYKARLTEIRNSDDIKSLRDEIAILRFMLETQLNNCEAIGDLLARSPVISDLISKIEKVVASAHKLEGSMGNLLDKQYVLNLASQIIGIIGNYVQDTGTIDNIANEIIGIIHAPAPETTD